MSLRTFTILAATICTSCGTAGLIARDGPLVEASAQEAKSPAKDITVADMECPSVDVAGSNLTSNLDAGCSKASRNPPTAVVADTRPMQPKVQSGPEGSSDSVALGLPTDPPPVAGGMTNGQPPAAASIPVGVRPPPSVGAQTSCQSESVENAAAGSMENENADHWCENPQPTQPSPREIPPTNITQPTVISRSPLLPAAVATPSVRLGRPPADTNQ